MKSTSVDMPVPAPPTAHRAPDAWVPGLRVGPWRLHERLHVSPGSEAWAASGRGVPDVVLKRPSAELLGDDGVRARFVDEARLCSFLLHANLCRIVLWDIEGPVPWLAFERLRGAPLSKLLVRLRETGTPMPVRVAAWLAAEVARGLHAAHQARDDEGRPLAVVHRDVCPDNLFVTFAGEVRVLDFGIATARARVARTVTGQLRGRLAYAAPEQARGVEVDARADQFSLGAVLFELLAGRQLHANTGTERLLARLTVEGAAFERVDVIAPRVPTPLATLVGTMLERTPDARFTSLREVIPELDAVVGASNVARQQLASLVNSLCPDVAQRTQRRRVVRVVVAGLALAAAIALGIISNTSSPVTPPPAPEVVVQPPTPAAPLAVTPAPTPQPVVLKGRFPFVTRPATTVYWQGRRVGESPLELELPAGKQRVRLVDEATQRVRWVSIDVKAGRGARLEIDFEALAQE